MTQVIPIQEATSSFDCKIHGCVNQAKLNRGYYAYLCDEHIAARKAAPPEPAAPKPPSVSGEGVRGEGAHARRCRP